MAKKIDKWEISSAVDTLLEAEKIKNDKILFPKVKAEFVRRMQETERVALELKVKTKQASIREKSK